MNMNTAVDAAQCKVHLASLLADESALLTQLEFQLKREHQLVTDNDVEGLDEAGRERQQCVGQLLKVEDERKALCRMLGQSADPQGIEKLIAWCDPQAQLLPALRQCTDQATRCRDQNLLNGALVSARLHRVSSMLSMLNVADTERPVYRRNGFGAAPPGVHTGRLLTTSA